MLSTAEEKIRQATVNRLRELRPANRIVHELNVMNGQRRADLASIGQEEIILVELKSKKDKLDRLSQQIAVFNSVATHTVAVVHDKFFDRGYMGETQWSAGFHYSNIAGLQLPKNVSKWAYPAVLGAEGTKADIWDLVDAKDAHPLPEDIVSVAELLWRAELMSELRSAHVKFRSSDSLNILARTLVYNLSGRAVLQAVCRQLRKRPFARTEDNNLTQIPARVSRRASRKRPNRPIARIG